MNISLVLVSMTAHQEFICDCFNTIITLKKIIYNLITNFF